MKFKYTDVALQGRGENAVVLPESGSVIITSNVLATNSNTDTQSIVLDVIEARITAISDEILLASAQSKTESEPIPFGNRLVELLQWILEIMKTHSHPPNAPPINTFFTEADRRSRNMKQDILNPYVHTR